MTHWPWLRRRPPAVPRDPEGVMRAEAELEHSTRQLAHDQAATIGPLRREAYRNNIQTLVVALLRPDGGAKRGGTRAPGSG